MQLVLPATAAAATPSIVASATSAARAPDPPLHRRRARHRSRGRRHLLRTVTDALGGTATAATAVRAQGLRLTLAPATIAFGKRAVARGALVPAEAGARVVIERRAGSSWQVVTSARTLSYGSTGPDVLALRARLAQLRVHVPGPSTTFGSELFDSVVAFQKARGLSRTGTVDEAT